jgi:SAM-dependent methyltransferase
MIEGRLLDSDPEVAARYRLNDIYCGLWLALAVTGAAATGLADHVDEDGTDATEIAARAGLDEGATYRLLRALAAHGVFAERAPRRFAHTPVSRLLRRDHPASWSGMARMWGHPAALRAWESLPGVLADGRSGMVHAHGAPLYAYLRDHPDALAAFTAAMVSNTAMASEAIARAFDFRPYRTVADLGGGTGGLLVALLGAHPHLKGMLVELPELTEPARAHLAGAGLAARVEVVAGDFMREVPPGADLYVIKNSLWNWDAEAAHAALTAVERALGPEGRLLLIEYPIEPANARWTTLYDLQQMMLPGGHNRTLPEYREALARAGLAVESVSYAQDQTLVLARRA